MDRVTLAVLAVVLGLPPAVFAALGASLSARPVILWTDALLYFLILVATGFALYARHRDDLRDTWRAVLARPLGMASLVVLGAYLAVGLLDSVHFRLPVGEAKHGEVHYAGESLSLLDLAATPLREGVEKTYSAPLAITLFVKETLERPDGTQVRDYPRLRYGGAHLDDPRDHTADVALRAVLGAGQGALLAFLVLVLAGAAYARRHRLPWATATARLLRGETVLPWWSALATLTVILVLAGVVAQLAAGYHVLGTDKVGNDVLYQSLKSIRTGLIIGTLTTLVMLPFALALGVMAGYFRGWVDDVIQYLYTTLSSIPGVLLIAAAVLMLQVYMANHPELFETEAERADLRLFFLCVILGITSWTGLCRMLRGEALKLREMDYVTAARALGRRPAAILARHLVPNVLHIVLISVVLDFSGLVLAEAVLSYVGVGVDPSMNSWGNMINSARLEMAREPMVWWSLAAAFVFMFVLVLAANLFADAVRDAFDPRHARTRTA